MSEQISNLLNDAQSTYRNQIAETKKYVAKWEKTGLLEGIDLDYEKHNTAILLENQARELVTENSKIGGTGAEEWNGVALPLVRRIFGKEFVSVQPMNLPSGLVFWLDFKYGTGRGEHDVNTDVMGNTSASSTPTGGLYRSSTDGKGAKAGYTLGKQTLTYSVAGNTGTAIGDMPLPAGASTVQVAHSNLTDYDADLAGAYYIVSSSGVILSDNAVVNGSNIDFTVDGTIAESSSLNVIYYKNTTTAAARGDFEDTTGGNPDKDATGDIGIPEMNVEYHHQ